MLRVADSGPGIAPEDRERVLLRFYRSARDQHIAGVGLGLSLVAAIAKLHEARVTIGDAAPGCVISVHFEGSQRVAARPVELPMVV